MEAIEFKRRSEKRSNMQTVGLVSSATLFGFRAVSAQDEARILQLPGYGLYRLPLQNSAGLSYFMPGVDTPGDPNHPIR